MYIYFDKNGLMVSNESESSGQLGRFYEVIVGKQSESYRTLDTIEFQKGNPEKVGINGVTNELLLAILIHRTRILNAELACEENKRAIEFMELALLEFETRAMKVSLQDKQALTTV